MTMVEQVLAATPPSPETRLAEAERILSDALHDRNNWRFEAARFLPSPFGGASPPVTHVEWGDWTVDDTDTAREILNYLGIGADASREPGADRRRDKIAEMIRARIDVAIASEAPKTMADILQKQSQVKTLRPAFTPSPMAQHSSGAT